MISVPFPLIPNQPEVEFRFTIRAARDLERAAGCSYKTLFSRGQQIEGVVMLTCFGLRHSDKSMTTEKAVDLIDAYVAGGGDVVTLYEALQRAMDESGVYGPPPTNGREPDPTKTPPTPMSASAALSTM